MARYGLKNFKCPETKHTDEKDDCPFDDCPYGSGDPSSLHRHKRDAHPEFVPAPRAATIPIFELHIVHGGSASPSSIFRNSGTTTASSNYSHQLNLSYIRPYSAITLHKHSNNTVFNVLRHFVNVDDKTTFVS
ncbi:hypothetical protein JR316_0011990 [Psilocybe cubensis]|uniref:Uncharacterized protein n=1 Tax=Psilocybe cubensis TaxID=181762 RepID=A0ACB8GLS3_PSICU|nr:hypothetical protein JR316_0011990 [Psilocybe cubensis]KAH9476415.1 hypothetical protein JR316_0011990 [Psilocybe cubensis]